MILMRKKDDSVLRYGRYFRFARRVLCFFSRKYRAPAHEPDGATVYVCRHLNMHGPYTTLKYMKKPFRPLVLNVFFTYKTCKKQFKDYTFSERGGMPRFVAGIAASVAAFVVAPLVRSARALPVYRGKTTDVVRTFRAAVAALERGERIMVYPDLEYTAEAEKESDIYDGFLSFDRYYFRKTGKRVPFVCILIDDKTQTLRAADPIYFTGSVPFEEEAPRVKAEIVRTLRQ